MFWKCPEKYIKAYIFFIIRWIEFKFGNVIDISIYLKNIKNVRKSTPSERTPHASHIAITPNAPLDAVNYHIKHTIPISLSNLHNFSEDAYLKQPITNQLTSKHVQLLVYHVTRRPHKFNPDIVNKFKHNLRKQSHI